MCRRRRRNKKFAAAFPLPQVPRSTASYIRQTLVLNNLALLFPVPSEKRMIDLLCGVTTLPGSSRPSTGCGLLAGAFVLIGSPSVRIHHVRQPSHLPTQSAPRPAESIGSIPREDAIDTPPHAFVAIRRGKQRESDGCGCIND